MNYVVDTNYFLQYHGADQVDWRELCADDEVVLLVPRAVQAEVDKLKQQRSNRLSRRARRAASIFREALRDANDTAVLRKSAPHVTLRLLGPLEQPKELHGLDPDTSDDRIVLDACVLRQQGQDVRLLTGDTGPLLSAKHAGVPFHMLPEEWLLAPEPDTTSVELLELKKRVGDLEHKEPQLTIDLTPPPTKGDALQIEVFALTEIESAINAAAELVASRHPLQTDFPTTQPGMQLIATGLRATSWRPPSAHEINKYTTEKYPEWQKRLRQELSSYIHTHDAVSRQVYIEARLSNSGSRSAQHVLLEIDVLEGGLELADQDEPGTEPPLHIPLAPDPPQGRLVGMFDSLVQPMAGFDHGAPFLYPGAPLLKDLARVPPKRERHAFYWIQGPQDGDKRWQLECEDLRHRTDPIIMPIGLNILPSAGRGKARLRVRVSAGNMSAPTSQFLGLEINVVERNAKSVLLPAVEEALRNQGGAE